MTFLEPGEGVIRLYNLVEDYCDFDNHKCLRSYDKLQIHGMMKSR